MKTGNRSCTYWPTLWTMTDKRQTRPLVREDARTGQDRNCQTVNYYVIMSPRQGSTPRRTDWRNVSRKLTRTRTLTRLQLKPEATYTSLSTQQATASICFSSTGQLVLLPVTSDRRPYSIAVAPQDEWPRTVVLHRNYTTGRAISCRPRTGLARLPNSISGKPFSGLTQVRWRTRQGRAVQCNSVTNPTGL
jgi:hypothetical protein